ncbi:MAG: hypothetical protein Q8P44_02325, partial [Dehalococcoidia bacterium]|nr:hypothetical protein [Dehalococcoidia bacterium]
MKIIISISLALLFLSGLVVGCDSRPAATPALAPTVRATVPVATPGIETKATPAPVRPTAAPTLPPAAVATPKPETRPYYEGKTIEMVVGSAAGGPTDMHARAIAMFIPNYVPGNPRVIIRNVPGGS